MADGTRSVPATLIANPKDQPADWRVFVSNHLPGARAVVGKQNAIAKAGAKGIDRQDRLAVSFSRRCEELHDEQLPTLHGWMLHSGHSLTNYFTYLHVAAHITLIPPAAEVERRCRVNVNGVVTPSPVGVAMLKLRYPSPPRPRQAGLGPFCTYKVVSISRPIRVIVSRFRE